MRPKRHGWGARRGLGQDTDTGDDSQTSNIDPYSGEDYDTETGDGTDDGTDVIGYQPQNDVVTSQSPATTQATVFTPGVAAGGGTPTAQTTTGTGTSFTSALTNLVKALTGQTPRVTTVARPAGAASSLTTPLLIGVGLLALVLVTRKRSNPTTTTATTEITDNGHGSATHPAAHPVF